MPAYASKALYTFIAFIFLILPHSALAHPSATIVCPINCDQSRVLFLKYPPQRGQDVKDLQLELRDLGFFRKPGNGVFDSDTDRAVRSFQKKFGLPVNGRVENSTWDVLAKAMEKPASASSDPPPEGKKAIIIDTDRCKLTLLVDGEPFKQFPVGLGAAETPTPIGTWKIVRKATNWGTGFGTRWMGLNVKWGIYGIHGTNKPYSIGGYQSHGCIRMHNSQVEQLYKWVSVGDPVIIVGNPFTYMDPTFKMMRQGDVGATVAEVQAALKRLGYAIEVDGVWGEAMEKVIIKYRKDIDLPFDNAVDRAVYKSLGFKD